MSNKDRTNKYRGLLVATGLVASVALVAPAFAQTTSSDASGSGATTNTSGDNGQHYRFGKGMGGMMGTRPGVFGTVSAINGTILTVTSKTWTRPANTGTGGSSGSSSVTPASAPSATPVTYTVDASGATVSKDGSSSTLSAVAVGDTVMIQGTVSGTSVTATKINDGVPPRGKGMMNGQAPNGTNPSSLIQGNGQPVVAGSVTAISGASLTITNKSNVTYTVDASNAKIVKDNATSSISSIATGDNVIIQGTVNGSAITASSVIDRGATPVAGSSTGAKPAPRGFFASIGNFFAHLFGF